MTARGIQMRKKDGRKHNKKTYHTKDLPFASFLHATRGLRFLRCEPVNGNGRVAFVFDDPEGEGEQLHIEFESAAEVPSAAFHDSVRHLRRVMKRVQNNGVVKNEYRY